MTAPRGILLGNEYFAKFLARESPLNSLRRANTTALTLSMQSGDRGTHRQTRTERVLSGRGESGRRRVFDPRLPSFISNGEFFAATLQLLPRRAGSACRALQLHRPLRFCFWSHSEPLLHARLRKNETGCNEF